MLRGDCANSACPKTPASGVAAKLGLAAPVWAGVGAWRLPVGSVIEKIRAAREAGASGVVLFSHESFAAADLDRLRAEAFPAPAGAPAAADLGARDHR